ncbi:MAG: hypothetical protein AAFR67_10035, partial [Chloroflexota bacterium]
MDRFIAQTSKLSVEMLGNLSRTTFVLTLNFIMITTDFRHAFLDVATEFLFFELQFYLDRVLYFAQYVVTDVDDDMRNRAISRIKKELKFKEQELGG